MPVRKIPKNHLHVTGRFARRKNGKIGIRIPSWSEEERARIKKLIEMANGTASLHELLAKLGIGDESKLYWLPAIWNMVDTHAVNEPRNKFRPTWHLLKLQLLRASIRYIASRRTNAPTVLDLNV